MIRRRISRVGQFSVLAAAVLMLLENDAVLNANPILSDSGAALKFEFCMLKNTTQADF